MVDEIPCKREPVRRGGEALDEPRLPRRARGAAQEAARRECEMHRERQANRVLHEFLLVRQASVCAAHAASGARTKALSRPLLVRNISRHTSSLRTRFSSALVLSSSGSSSMSSTSTSTFTSTSVFSSYMLDE